VGIGLHVVRVRLRPATVPRGLRVSRARANPYATGTVAGRTGNVAAASAPVTQVAGQGPEHQDHVTGCQTA